MPLLGWVWSLVGGTIVLLVGVGAMPLDGCLFGWVGCDRMARWVGLVGQVCGGIGRIRGVG